MEKYMEKKELKDKIKEFCQKTIGFLPPARNQEENNKSTLNSRKNENLFCDSHFFNIISLFYNITHPDYFSD